MAIYYVDGVSGNDSTGTGATGSPWKTLAKANTAASAGDTVRVRTATYYEKLVIAKTNLVFEADAGHTPTIDGRYHPGLFGATGYVNLNGQQIKANEVPSYTSANANRGNWVVVGEYANIVGLQGTGVKLKGFIIRNVCGRPVIMNGNGAWLEDCIVDFCYSGAIVMGTGSNMVIHGCTVTRASMKKYDPSNTKPNGKQKGTQTTIIINECADAIVEETTVAFNYGEGISCDKGSVRPIIRYCVTHTNNHWNLGINETTGAKIYGNISYWCDNLVAAMDKDTPSDCFTVGNELVISQGNEYPERATLNDVYIYNNLFIGGKRTFMISSGSSGRPCAFKRGYIGYNTWVGRAATDEVVTWGLYANNRHENTVVENNVILIHPGSTFANYIKFEGGAGVTFRNNLCNKTFPSGMGGPGSITTALNDPTLANAFPANINGTYDKKSVNLPSVATTLNVANFDLGSSSQAIGRASNRSSPYSWTIPAITIDRYRDGRTDMNLSQGRYYDIGADEFGGTVVPPTPTVTAAFSMSPAATTITVGASASFTNQSFANNCNITGYTWTVKRGATTMHTATTTNLNNYTFSQDGTWTVTLAVATDATGVTDTEVVTITVNPTTGEPSVTAAFSRSPSATTIDQGTTIQFANDSTVTNTTKTGQTWEVRTSPGNVLVTSATTNNFTHLFDTAGTFIVKLTVDTAAGVSDTEQVTITVNAVSTAAVTSAFTGSTGSTIDEGTAVTFTNASTVDDTTISGYLWTVTNGSVSVTYTTEDITHTFSQAGTWTVTLHVDTAAGVSDDSSVTLIVRAVSSSGAGLYKSMVVPYRAALNTSTGEQEITATALGTLTPKGMTIRLTGATADATAADGALWAEGATDGAAQWSYCLAVQDNAASGGAKRRYESGILLQTIDPTGAVTGEAVFARFVPGGVVLDITDAFPAAYLAQIDFYAGDDMRVAAGTALLSTVGADVPVATGIDADLAYFATTWAPDGAASATIEADFTRGWALKTGAQMAVRNQNRDAMATSALTTRYANTYCAVSGDGTTGTLAFVEARDWTPSGFNLRLYTNALDTRPLGWFAAELGGPGVHLSMETLTAGASSEHFIPFQAQTVLALPTVAAGTVGGKSYNDANAEGVGYYATSVYDSLAEYMMWICAADGAGTYDAKSWSDNAFRAIDHDGSSKWDGVGTIDTDNITFGFTTNPAAYIIVLLAVEQSDALPEDEEETPPPTVDFAADVRAGETKLLVRFDSSLTNDHGEAITAYLWDFGDGATSTAANPSHIYKTEGEFTVTLTVTNANGSSTVTKEAYITAAYPVRRRTLVGPSRSLAVTSSSTTRVDLDHPQDEDWADEFGYHTHPVESINVLRLLPLTTEEIAMLAAETDGVHVAVCWNTDTNAINVIDTEGVVHAV